MVTRIMVSLRADVSPRGESLPKRRILVVSAGISKVGTGDGIGVGGVGDPSSRMPGVEKPAARVGQGKLVGVFVAVGVFDGVGVAVGVFDGVGLGPKVGELLGVGVEVTVAVAAGVTVAEREAVDRVLAAMLVLVVGKGVGPHSRGASSPYPCQRRAPAVMTAAAISSVISKRERRFLGFNAGPFLWSWVTASPRTGAQCERKRCSRR